MDNVEENILEFVLNGFLQSEYEGAAAGDPFKALGAISGKSWDQFDTNMCHLKWLSDDEVYREASLAHEFHVKNNARCSEVHQDSSHCAIPIILSAISELLVKHENGGSLNTTDRYMFEYYLCLEQGDMIVTDDVAK